MTRGWRALALMAAMALGACRASVPPASMPMSSAAGSVHSGKASYYGERFHGRKTASGERFDMHAMTAAHRTLPFGTMVRVTNASNGKSVVVRINDRGPFGKRTRIIDVSQGAAAKLDMIRAGIADVTLEVVAAAR